jgi:PAS domain S-box-containing protein
MNKPQILIIDDETTIHMTISKSLKNDEFEFLHAQNGKEGLEKMLLTTPSLIFLDLSMPVMDGFTFLDHISIKPSDPYLVVVITGHGDDTDVKKSFDKGVNFFLRKPLSMTEINCLTKRCIEMKENEIELREHRDNLEKMVKERTRALQHQLQFQQNLIDSIPTPIFFKDTQHTFLGCNRAFEKCMAVPRKNIIGKTIHEVADEKTAVQFHNEYIKAFRNGACTFECILKNNGTDRNFIISNAIFKTKEKNSAGLIGAMFDISEQKKVEETLLTKTQELEDANKALRVVLDQIGLAKTDVEKRVYRNVKETILPDLERLKKTTRSPNKKKEIEVIRTNLNKISSVPAQKKTSVLMNLSPREIQIADLIRMGKSSKTISIMLDVTKSAVEFHRNNLRKKLGIRNRDINLRTYLMNMD